MRRAALLLPCLLISVLCYSPTLHAQSSAPSATIGFDLPLHSGSDSQLSSYWDLPSGASIYGSFPFYIGEMELRATWAPMRAREISQPDLNNLLTTIGWGVPVQITRRFRMGVSIHIGNSFMYRPEHGFLENPESEFTAGFVSYLQISLTKRIALRASARATRIYTYHRMDLVHGKLGLSYAFRTPTWLHRFVQ
ncbi:MAG: hypothetical protein WD315_00390 [Balneolaceae bacterium]